MAFDMLEAMTLIAREKNIDLDAVVETLEASLLAAAKKKYAYTDNISFKFDRKNNELFMIAVKKVVEKVSDATVEISLDEAKEIDAEAELGDEIDIYLDYEMEFGRNAIASAKQILIQKIRDVEHERIYGEYIDKVGTLVSGVVQQIDKGNVIINLGRGEGILPVKEQIPNEKFRQGDRIRALILDVQNTPRGPQIVLSRVNDEFLRNLFALEVPEIYERVIEIKAIAREPGERAKVAVYSSDERIDPVGACVGIKGVRVQSIVRELNNERIDIVPFSSNSEVFVTRALAPAKVVAIDMFDLEKKMTVVVDDEKLSLAIGRNGQNARLASKLTGWKVNILSETEYNENKRREAEMLVPVGQLEGVGEKIRDRLIAADISSVQRLAQTSVEMLTKIEGFGQKTAETLVNRAKAFVEELEIKQQEKEALEKATTDKGVDEDKLEASDVFNDDEEYVTEADDVPEATAPDLDGVEEDEEKDD
ncbi:MAG: transcription termination/antitermination protein NusA [candidate division Zixibacteria bacterium]|nr:transcription termination/antitermination protein NusA [candidate division Zixibacteria bacterium]